MRSALALLFALGLLSGCTASVHGHASAVARTSAPSTSSGGSAPTSAPRPASPTTVAPAPSSSALPLRFTTGDATQVITVVAASQSSTTATLRAWVRTSHGWVPTGGTVEAHLGTDGLSTHPSEAISATPIGSFTLTRAFGHDPDPGTALPYTQTNPSDWWISQPGPLYNTMQSCTSRCGFTQGDPNEHLYDETPYYLYAVVIDYNTANSPTGVRQGAGSAFFLHVTVGQPTQGCISIPEQRLVELLRWLTPRDHPRILIGVG